jgi:hypothetical protein
MSTVRETGTATPPNVKDTFGIVKHLHYVKTTKEGFYFSNTAILPPSIT